MINFFSPSNWSFKVKFFVPCLLAIGLMTVLTMQALDDINQLKRNLTFVVNNRFDASVILTQSVEHLRFANGALYQMQTRQAAGIQQDIKLESKKITEALDAAVADLNKFNANFASPEEKKKIDEAIASITNYKDAVNFVASMLEINFKTTVNFITPLEGVYNNVISYLTSLVDQYLEDSKHLSKAGSEDISKSLGELMKLSMIAILFTIFITLYIVVSTDKSIRTLAYATRRVSEGDKNFDLSTLKRGDELGQIVSVLSLRANELMREVEMRRELQSELERAKTHAEASSLAKSQFLANMSHEIRTPMNAIIGFSDLMILITNPTPTQLDYMKTVMESAENLLTIINDILDFSKIEAGLLTLEKGEYNLRNCIEKVFSLLRIKVQEKQLTLVLDYPGNVPSYVVGDQGRVRQILINLLGNAIKFTKQGEIRVTVRGKLNPQGSVDFLIKIQDGGIGIPKDKQEHIFEKFTQADDSTTRKYGGTGLGLAISKQLVELMGGTIGVESEPGKGATFWFMIRQPIVEAGSSSLAAPEEPDMQTLGKSVSGRRVLVAEDNDVNRKVIFDMLQNLGCAVTTVTNGVEAMEALKRDPFDIIFIDCQMQEMDGFQATRAIRQLAKDGAIADIPIIAITANVLIDNKNKCLEAGMSDFLAKPFKISQIVDMLQKWI